MEVKVYHLNDPDELESFNQRLNFIGLSIQSGILPQKIPSLRISMKADTV